MVCACVCGWGPRGKQIISNFGCTTPLTQCMPAVMLDRCSSPSIVSARTACMPAAASRVLDSRKVACSMIKGQGVENWQE